MRRHEFGFGSAVAAEFLVGDDANVPRYRERVKALFNRVTIESDLKWPHWEDLENRKLALAALDWLEANKLPVRGHCLLWGGWSWMPDDIYRLRDSPAALRKRVTEHLLEEVAALRGRLIEWDVVNEPGWYDVLTDVLGPEIMQEWYALVRFLDPGAKLYINEYGVLSGSSYYSDTTQSEYERTIRDLLQAGAPVDGIGLQGHFSWTLPSPCRILDGLDRFAALGLPIQITELDIDIRDETLQAEYKRDVMTAFFSHPSVSAIIMWGFWEGRHWRPDAALYRLDWSLKPCGEVWQELVFGDWWTDVEGETDANGQYAVRGFRGAYDVTVTVGDRTRDARLLLPEGGCTRRIVLD
jgi:GH35 family endo-1,4-beta-xylanase